jgi:hypothetical protein
MKNIHLLPTDKPSRLHFDSELFISPEIQLSKSINSIVEGRNIYITSDEEIKKGGNFLDLTDNTLWKNKGPESMSRILFPECKKVILSTDPDLIADGVQSINDEFLEWFIKNPSCESVEVKPLLSNNGRAFYGYRIVIPQEDPFEKSKLALRAYLLANKEKVNKDLQEMREKSSVDRNETVEEAAETWVFETNGHKWSNNDDTAGDNYGSFMAGAEWQSERMYSEEEVEKMVRAAYTFGEKEFKYFGAFKEWFEQFKKK